MYTSTVLELIHKLMEHFCENEIRFQLAWCNEGVFPGWSLN